MKHPGLNSATYLFWESEQHARLFLIIKFICLSTEKALRFGERFDVGALPRNICLAAIHYGLDLIKICFEFWSLYFIWDLYFDIWNFYDLHINTVSTRIPY
jgi:hypothetical protein